MAVTDLPALDLNECLSMLPGRRQSRPLTFVDAELRIVVFADGHGELSEEIVHGDRLVVTVTAGATLRRSRKLTGLALVLSAERAEGNFEIRAAYYRGLGDDVLLSRAVGWPRRGPGTCRAVLCGG